MFGSFYSQQKKVQILHIVGVIKFGVMVPEIYAKISKFQTAATVMSNKNSLDLFTGLFYQKMSEV